MFFSEPPSQEAEPAQPRDGHAEGQEQGHNGDPAARREVKAVGGCQDTT